MSNQAESIQDNLNVMKCIHQIILDFVDDKIDLQSLLNNFANQKIREKSRDLRYLLHILAEIANNHNRSHNMIGKIEQILKELQEDIKKNFQKIEIFDFFKGNKVILLFLFKQNIISPDKYIFDYITDDYYISQNYPQFFYSEFSSFFSKELKEKINKNGQIQIPTNELKDQDREVGENTFDLCELIRKDNVSEFESFIQSKSYSPSTQIPKSIYETNSPIVNKKLTLIEYSCFCGSNQIFQYLKEKVARLISGLWSYAVHGNNLEIIKTLEENNIQPPNSSYKKVYDESILCHHNELAKYLKEKHNIKNDFSTFCECLRSFNFIYLTESIQDKSFNLNSLVYDNPSSIYFLCKYGYYNIVELFINDQNLKFNEKVI